MKKPINSAFFLILALLVIGCSNNSDPTSSQPNRNNTVNYTSIDWVSSSVVYSDEPQAKPLSILYFTDDACSDGFLMENNTFLDSQIIVTLNSTYNMARISTSNDSLISFNDSLLTGNQLFHLYNLVGVPSMLILDSEDRYFGRIQAGYYPSDTFLVLLEYYKNKEQ